MPKVVTFNTIMSEMTHRMIHYIVRRVELYILK